MTNCKFQSTEEQLGMGRQWENSLRQALYRSSCPSTQDLGEFQLGMLASAAADQINLHLESCPHCTQELVKLDDFLVQTEPVKLSTQKSFHFASWVQDKIRVLTAQIMPDFSMGLETVSRSVRNIGHDAAVENFSKSIMYMADEISGSLEVQLGADKPEMRTVEVIMSVPEPDKWSAEAWRTDLDKPIQVANENSGLELSNLALGIYTFVLTDGMTEIYLEDIDIA